MKLSGGKRVLMFFHWLFSLLICAGLVTYILWPDFIMQYYHKLDDLIGHRYLLICAAGVLALYLILVIAQLALIFKRRKKADRGFIMVTANDNTHVRIAIPAIEQMVRKSVTNIDGITDMKIAIENMNDSIQIGVRAAVENGRHVPSITANMQQAIREFVEMNCGVKVSAVPITITSVTGHVGKKKKKGAPAALIAAPETEATPETPAQEPAVPEEPEEYKAAPVVEEEAAPVEETVTATEPEAPECAPEAPEFEVEPAPVDEPIVDEPVEDEPVDDEPEEVETVEDEPVEDEPAEAEPVEDEAEEADAEPVVFDAPAEDEDAEPEACAEPEEVAEAVEDLETAEDAEPDEPVKADEPEAAVEADPSDVPAEASEPVEPEEPMEDPIARYFADLRARAEEEASEAPESSVDDEH